MDFCFWFHPHSNFGLVLCISILQRTSIKWQTIQKRTTWMETIQILFQENSSNTIATTITINLLSTQIVHVQSLFSSPVLYSYGSSQTRTKRCKNHCSIESFRLSKFCCFLNWLENIRRFWNRLLVFISYYKSLKQLRRILFAK